MNKQRVERPKSSEQRYWQSARIVESNFINRQDVHAVQIDDGRYVCMNGPATTRQIIGHLKGEITLGTYLLSEEDKATFTVLDADDDVQYYLFFRIADDLLTEGDYSYIEQSRRGGQLWFFHEEPVSGDKAKRFGEGIAAEYKLGEIEVFPKQERTSGGPGSLIRLPFGVHRKSGKRYPFVRREDGMPIATNVHDQVKKMMYPNRVGIDVVDWYSGLAPKKEIKERSSEVKDNIWARIKAAEPAVDFIGRYIDLTPTSKGAIGYCPFHQDEVKSFSVNRVGKYWNCFAGCGGGSIIDFYMKLKNVELGEAVHDLRKMLEVD